MCVNTSGNCASKHAHSYTHVRTHIVTHAHIPGTLIRCRWCPLSSDLSHLMNHRTDTDPPRLKQETHNSTSPRKTTLQYLTAPQGHSLTPHTHASGEWHTVRQDHILTLHPQTHSDWYIRTVLLHQYLHVQSTQHTVTMDTRLDQFFYAVHQLIT